MKEASELLSLGATESAGLGLEAGQTPSPSTPDLPPETPSSPTSSSATALSHRARAPSTTTTDGPPSRQERRSQKAPFPSAGFPRRAYFTGPLDEEAPVLLRRHPGAAALKSLWKKGVTLDVISKVIFHFPPGKATRSTTMRRRPASRAASRWNMSPGRSSRRETSTTTSSAWQRRRPLSLEPFRSSASRKTFPCRTGSPPHHRHSRYEGRQAFHRRNPETGRLARSPLHQRRPHEETRRRFR